MERVASIRRLLALSAGAFLSSWFCFAQTPVTLTISGASPTQYGSALDTQLMNSGNGFTFNLSNMPLNGSNTGTATISINLPPATYTLTPQGSLTPPAQFTYTITTNLSNLQISYINPTGNTSTSGITNVATGTSSGTFQAGVEGLNIQGVNYLEFPFGFGNGPNGVGIQVYYTYQTAATDSISFALSGGSPNVYPLPVGTLLQIPNSFALLPAFYAVAQVTLSSKPTGQVVLQISDQSDKPIDTGPPITVLQGNRLVGNVGACYGQPGSCLEIPAMSSDSPNVTSVSLVAMLLDPSGNPLAKTAPITYQIQQPSIKLTLGTRPFVTFSPLPATTAILAAMPLGTSVPGATMEVDYDNLPQNIGMCSLFIHSYNDITRGVLLKGTSGTIYVDVSALRMFNIANEVFNANLLCSSGVGASDTAAPLTVPLVLISPQAPTPADSGLLPLNTKTGFSFPINYQIPSGISGQLVTTVAWGDGSPVFTETDPISGSNTLTITPPAHTFSSGAFAGETMVTTRFKQADGSCPCTTYKVATYGAAGATVTVPPGPGTTAGAGSKLNVTNNTAPRTEQMSVTANEFTSQLGKDLNKLNARPGTVGPALSSMYRPMPLSAGATPAASSIPSFIGVDATWSFSPSIPADGSFAANLTLYYSSADLPNDPNFSESAMQIISYDPSSGAFESYPTTVDTSNKTATASITSLAPYYSLAVLGPFSQSLIDLPWFFESNGMDTKLALVNAGGSDAHLSVNGYGADGTLLAQNPSAITISANTQLLNSVSSLGFSTTNIGTAGWAQTPADVNTLVGVETIGNGTQFDALPLATGHAPYSVITDIEFNDVYDTEIDVVNPTAGILNFVITLQNPDGSTAGTYTGALLPEATFSGTVDRLFNSIASPFYGYATVTGDGDVVASALISSYSSLAGVAGHPVSSQLSGPITLVGAQLGAANEFTRVILVNAGSTTANLVFTAYQPGGTSAAIPVTKQLAPGAQMIADLTTLFGLANPTAGSFTITSDQPTVFGDLTFSDTSFAQASRASVPLVTAGAASSVVPYVENDSGAAATINISNPNSAPASVIVTTLDSTGKQQGAMTVSIPANGATALVAPGTVAGGYVTLSSTQPVAAFAVVAPTSGTDIAAIAAQPAATVATGPGGGSQPSITAAAVVNAASFLGGSIAPGEVVTIFGSNFGPPQIATLQVSNGAVTTNIGNTQVLFNNVAAPMIYSTIGQVSAIVPYEVAGQSTAEMQLIYNGVASNTVTLTVAAAAPALFTANSSGTGPGAILNQDYSVNSATNQAAAGSIVQLFGTTEGVTNPTGVDGKLTVAPFPTPVLPVSVTIGGINAPTVYVGEAPGLVAGVFQIDATVPTSVPSGNQPVVVTVGNVSSPSGVTVAVKNPSVTGMPAIMAGTLPAFGNVTVGQTSTQMFTISSSGTAALIISSITSPNAAVTVTAPPPSAFPLTLQPGATQQVTVQFAPTAAGTVSGNLTINSNAGTAPLVPFSGNGVVSGGAITSTLTITGSGTSSGGNVSATGTASLSGIGTGTFSSNFSVATATLSGSAPITITITSGNPTGTLTGVLTGSLTLLAQVLAGTPNVSGPATITFSSGTLGFAGATGSFNVTASGTGTGGNGSGGGTFSITGPGTLTIPGGGTGGTPTIATSSGVNFSSVAQGGSRQANLTVKNTGNAPLNVTNVTGSGAFSVISSTTFMVAAGSSSTVMLQFNPTTPGGQTGTVNIASNDPVHPNLSVAVWGNAYVPANVLTSDSFNRANAGECALGQSDLALGGTTQYYYLPVWPGASAPAGASISGGVLANNSSGSWGGVQLTSSSDTCNTARGASLAQDLDIVVDVYVPMTGSDVTDAGPYFRSRAAAPGDGLGGGTSSGYWVEVFSTGQVVVNQLNPFGVIAQTATPASFDSTLVHTLEANVQGTSLQVTLDGNLQTFTQNGASTTTVTVSTASNDGTAGISFGAQMNPGLAGGQTASNLVISSVGSAAPPTISAPTTPLAFNNVPVGQISTLTLNVQNTGSAALTVNTVTISNPVFGLMTPTIPITVQPGATTQVTLTFAPLSSMPVPQTATMTINSNDPNHPSVPVTLTGTGTGSPTSLAYSNVVVGQSEMGTATFTNNGTTPIVFTGFTTTNAAFVVTSPAASTAQPYTLAGGQSVTVDVSFTPSAYTVYNATLNLVTAAGNYTTALTGAGVVVQ